MGRPLSPKAVGFHWVISAVSVNSYTILTFGRSSCKILMRADTYHPQVAKKAKNIPCFDIPRFPRVSDMFNLLSI